MFHVDIIRFLMFEGLAENVFDPVHFHRWSVRCVSMLTSRVRNSLRLLFHRFVYFAFFFLHVLLHRKRASLSTRSCLLPYLHSPKLQFQPQTKRPSPNTCDAKKECKTPAPSVHAQPVMLLLRWAWWWCCWLAGLFAPPSTIPGEPKQ
jgi:hypothetical protein